MTRVRLFCPVIATMLLLTAATATADEAGKQLAECADVEDDARRLQCYDRVLAGDGKIEAKAEAGEEAPASASPVTPTQPTAAAAPLPDADEAAVGRFGLDAEPDPREDEPDQISARITGLDFQRYGERVFTLDNGQVWVEKSGNQGLRLRVGDSVTIKRGLFRSHKLFGSGNKSTSVDRVR